MYNDQALGTPIDDGLHLEAALARTASGPMPRTSADRRLVRREIVDALTSLERPADVGASRRGAAISGEDVAGFARMLTDDIDRAYVARAFVLAERLGDPDEAFHALFEPAARRVGDDWRADTCDFLKVTIALSRLQRLVRDFQIAYPPQHKPAFNKTVLLLPTPGEQHNFGLSLIAERLRRRGWNVDHHGALSERALRKAVTGHDYCVIGLSLSTDRLLGRLTSTIRHIREGTRRRPVDVMVGGRCFFDNNDNMNESGADYAATDANDALAIAESCAEKKFERRSAARVLAQT